MRCPTSGSPASRSTSVSPGTWAPMPDPAPGTVPPVRGGAAGRYLALLPPGTLAVGAGLMVLGAGYYVHLAVAGHSLAASGMAAMSVLWSIVFLLGLGVFLPIEQELIRHVASRRAMG